MIGPDLYDASFLDLFAGSGQIGIESLSRGAAHAVFVEKNKKALDCIRDNIKKCGFENESSIICGDCYDAIKSGHFPYVFDFVFMDPPYDHLIEKEILVAIKDRDFIDKDTTIIVEASLDTDFSYVSDLGFILIKQKIYKTNQHIFLKLA